MKNKLSNLRYLLLFLSFVPYFYKIQAQCPQVTSENGMRNGIFSPAWTDCALPSAPIFDSEHFTIDPNSPFNYDENTPYYQVSYPLLKKWMGRTTYTLHPQPMFWFGSNYCGDSLLNYYKKNMLDFIYEVLPYNAKALSSPWGEICAYEKDFQSYNIMMDLACEVHGFEDSLGNNIGKDVIIGCYLAEILPENKQLYPIPDWVYAYFDETPPTVPQVYDTEEMKYLHDWQKNGFGEGAIIPDMSRKMTQYFYFERASHYIDAGCELVSLGQLEIMDDNDPGHVAYFRLIKAIKKYAAKNARRHFVLMEGETQGLYFSPDFQTFIENEHPELLPKNNNKKIRDVLLNDEIDKLQRAFFTKQNVPLEKQMLLFDYHNQPLRMQETELQGGTSPYSYMPTELKDDDNWVFGKSEGGMNTNGFIVEHNPYYAMIDNGSVGRAKFQSDGICDDWQCIFQWGFDELTWYALQPDWYRMYWTCYMKNWLNEVDTSAYVVHQGMRGYAWQLINHTETYFSGIYAPNSWEIMQLQQLAEEPETTENCIMPSQNLHIKGEQAISSPTTAITINYSTDYFPNQKYVWRLIGNGFSQVATDSNIFTLTVFPHTDTTYELSVYTLDNTNQLQAASLDKFLIKIGNFQQTQISPNPVHNLLSIVNEQNIEELSVYDAMGKLTHFSKPQQKMVTFPTANLANGIYFLVVKSSTKREHLKFLKQ